MISKSVCGEAMKITEHLTYCKESKLVAAVEDQIAVNPSVFHKFLSMLRGDPSLVYIADAMSDHYRKYIGKLLHNLFLFWVHSALPQKLSRRFTFVSFGGDIKPSVPGNPLKLA